MKLPAAAILIVSKKYIMKREPLYRSFILRLRHRGKREAETNAWYISLQETGNPQEIFFTTLDALMIYLTAQLQVIIPELSERGDSHE